MKPSSGTRGEYVVGIDVGTGSVRAGVFDLSGTMAAHASREITLWKPREHFVEQSSDQIWAAACEAVREAVRGSRVSPASIVGISFDATCSLVALDADERPVSVSPTGEPSHNIIVWMDHRAISQADRINATKHRVLSYVGGRISPEMETPKLLWIKENMPETWRKAARYYDLADYMVHRAAGTDVRSLCTTVCKWTYDGQHGRWDRSYFRKLGMEELLTAEKIGTTVVPMGTFAGPLTNAAASDMGLSTGTAVAVGMIDAHAGGIGVIGMGFAKTPRPAQMETVLALIGGTSSCHMAVSRQPKYIPGVWGPYWSAMLPGLWLTEGGQSATGALIDHIISNNDKHEAITREAEQQGKTVYEFLNDTIAVMQEHGEAGPEIAREINVLPYFLGNRSPHADPAARGMISGLQLDDSIESVALLYYATIQAIAYGTRDIIEAMNRRGYRIRRILACGGGTKNPIWLQEHADITGCDIILPRETEAVLLGSAMLAAVGAERYPSILDASMGMGHAGETIKPRKVFRKYHEKRYTVFKKMYRDFQAYRKVLSQR